jgi:sugar lactone lactonase YvrE
MKSVLTLLLIAACLLPAAAQEKDPVIIHSDTAFLLPDRALHLESIAIGKGNVYGAAVHQRKIVRFHQDTLTDFTTEAQDSLTAVLGIKLDEKRNILWACASPLPEMKDYKGTETSALFKYDLATGKLLAKYKTVIKTKSCFGDLLISSKGAVFISDSWQGTIYTLSEKTQTLVPWFTSPEFRSLQGIAFSDDERYLFLADYSKGIFRLDVKSKKLILLANPQNVSVKGIDGLLWYKNSLIAIQNGTTPQQVTILHLNATRNAVAHGTIIDRGHPSFNEPTNGCIVYDTFYYIANSKWPEYDKLHNLRDVSELSEPVILKTVLQHK